MNLGQLRQECQHRTGYSADEYEDRWNTHVNAALREFARVYPWEGLEDLISVTTDGTPFVILPHYVDTVLSVLNTTQHLPVDRSGEWDRTDPSIYSQRTTGTVFFYDKLGTVPALRDPTGYLWFQSSHASDLSTLYITGRAANSGASGTALSESVRTLSVTAAGTSPTTLSTLFTRIDSISKTTDTNGDFFFYDAGATNAHISHLGRFDRSAEFRRLQLMFAPAAQTSLRIRYRPKLPPLRSDAQSPHPAVRPDFVIGYAIKLFWEEREQYSKANNANNEARRVLQDEINREHNFNEPYSQIMPDLRDPDPDYTTYFPW